MLALEYLRFEDGRLAGEKESRREEFQAELLTTVVKGSLVASQGYEEKVLFEEYFPSEEPEGGMGGGDADVDFDYSDVDFGTPDMDELALLESLLSDSDVTVSGAPLEGPGAVQVDREDDEGPDVPLAHALEPPREFELPEPDPDSEWT